ncbi:MAG: MaoC family dehydratase N-terminal domain-containing protein [Bifidobacteriaceae bacterium]|jgi:acyl dehydratase|nr:MaoC family dehydratase N-terminal domain-containing protein [Bifidobacteriaceae bacterium]
MPVDPSWAGRTYPESGPYLVDGARLREFAVAVGTAAPACFDPAAAQALGYADVVAAPTFAAVIAQQAEAQYVRDPAAGIDFARVVHAEESFEHHRPIVAGDRLWAALTVKSIVERAGIAMVTTQVALHDAVRRPVATVVSTLAVRGEPVTMRAEDKVTDGSGRTLAGAGAQRRPGAVPGVAYPVTGAGGVAPDTFPPVTSAQGVAPGTSSPVAAAQGVAPGSSSAVAEVRRAPAQAGDRIGPVSVALTRADLGLYADASGDHNIIHRDDQAAREVGLPGVIAHGMLTMGRAVQLLVDWAGPDPGAVERYTARFARPVPVPPDGSAELAVAGEVVAVAGDAATVNLVVTLDGHKVLGKTQAVVRPRSADPAGS